MVSLRTSPTARASTCKGRGSSAGLVSSLCVSQHCGALSFSLERHLSLHVLTLIQENLAFKRNQIQELLLSSAPDGNCSLLIIQSGKDSDHFAGENVCVSKLSPVLRLDRLGLFSDASSQPWTSIAKMEPENQKQFTDCLVYL